MKKMLSDVNLKGELIDYTVMKMSRLPRDAEIAWWLEDESENSDINFAIIDDNNFFSRNEELYSRFVQTEGFEVGISKEDVDKLINLFNSNAKQ
jgi:hypothetical protein